MHAAVYTHGHVDHAFGLPPFLDEAREQGAPRPRIVGHRNLVGRFDRYRKTRGYNACINQRQFSLPRQLEWPERYEYPDVTYDAEMTLEAGSTRLELRHARGETDDHTWAWWPEAQGGLHRRPVRLGLAQCGQSAEGAALPRRVGGVVCERWRPWSRRSWCPATARPSWARIASAQALRETAEWLEHLVRETLERMNAGAELDAILHEVGPPAHLAERPYLQPVYDDPEFVVRNVWRLYGGWYDGTASHLRPAPESDIGREVARLAGGVDALAERARELGKSGELRLAAHLADWAVRAEPGNDGAHAVRAEIYEARAGRSRALMSKGVFNAAARESREKAGGDGA